MKASQLIRQIHRAKKISISVPNKYNLDIRAEVDKKALEKELLQQFRGDDIETGIKISVTNSILRIE
jgi:hypothetical protein|tara:strand:+ start:728 stop:928 length:201 start_codon:yes stop_codon:yes gene_type:complete